MKHFWLALILCAAIPAPAQTSIPPPIAGIEAGKFPRLDGSTSTVPLGLLLWGRGQGFPVELRRGQSWRWSPQGEILPTFPVQTPTQTIRDFFRQAMQMPFEGTGKAYLNLIQNKRDLILVARPPSKSESEAAKKAGVQLELKPIARDALVFLVNDKNLVKTLSSAQLRAIFTGKTKLWRQLGGRDFPILALTRNENSGSQELLDALLLPGQKLGNFEPNTREDAMGAIIDRVAQNPNAIGYSVYYYEKFMAPREQNRVLQVDGIEPNFETIKEQKYPFTAPVFVVVRAGLKSDSPTLKLRDWLLGEDGQKLVEESGYVPAS